MPLSIVVSNLIRFGIQMLLFICAILVYYFVEGIPIDINIYILWFPVLILLMAAMGLGAGMIISALTTKYRDLAPYNFRYTVTYGTTVIYPLSSAKPEYLPYIKANPMTSILETFRYSFFGQRHI